MADQPRARPVDPDAVHAVRGASGLNAVAGVWLIASPFVLGHAGVAAAMWNEIVVGAIVLAVGLVRLTQPQKMRGISWVNAVLGVWLIAAPFVLNYHTAGYAMWNDVVLGVLITALAVWSALPVSGKQRAV